MSTQGQSSAALRARLSLAAHQFHYTHALGQNFLLDEAVIARILDAAQIQTGDRILEIGPGAGVMTVGMAQRGARVLAVEIDQSLEPVLHDVVEANPNIHLCFADALKIDLSKEINETLGVGSFRVIANLPYYITTDILLKLIGLPVKPSKITVMVQAEAAERVMARPGQKSYCALAAKVQYYGNPGVLLRLFPEAFYPNPHVESCLLQIEAHAEPIVKPADEALFLRLIDACFAMRRKTLANNLRASMHATREQAEEWLGAAGLPVDVRGESLSLQELARLADVIAIHRA